MGFYTDIVGLAENVQDQLESALGSMGVTAVIGEIATFNSWPLTPTGTLKPTAIIEMPGIGEGSPRGRALTGAKHSTARSRFNVLCAGPTALTCIKVTGLVADALIGFKPLDSIGELSLIPSVMLTPTMQTGAPVRYVMPVGFKTIINTTVVS